MSTIKLTTDLLHAYLSRTEVSQQDLLDLIRDVHYLLGSLAAEEKAKAVVLPGMTQTVLNPSVSVVSRAQESMPIQFSVPSQPMPDSTPRGTDSVAGAKPVGSLPTLSVEMAAMADSADSVDSLDLGDDALTCLICGKSYRFFRDHLRKAHNLSASDYRKQCNLADDFPLMPSSVLERRKQKGANAKLTTISAMDSSQLTGGFVGKQLAFSLTAVSEPAVPIDEAVSRDSVTCLVCGYSGLFLKTHLQTKHELSVDAYRKRFSLPDNFPIVAPSYSENRRKKALDLGWGEKKNKIHPEEMPAIGELGIATAVNDDSLPENNIA